MQVKVFSAFSEFEARFKLGQWLKTHPNVRVTRQETKAATEGVGSFEGRSLYQIIVAYESRQKRASA